jgi:hypothetical protein
MPRTHPGKIGDDHSRALTTDGLSGVYPGCSSLPSNFLESEGIPHPTMLCAARTQVVAADLLHGLPELSGSLGDRKTTPTPVPRGYLRILFPKWLGDAFAESRSSRQSSSLNSAPSWRRRSFLWTYSSTASPLWAVSRPVELFNHSVCSLRRSHISVVIFCIRPWCIPAGCSFSRQKSVQL